MDLAFSRKRIKLYRVAIIGVWLGVLLLSALLLMQSELSRVRGKFDAQTSQLSLELTGNLALQETSLEGFANFLSVMPEIDLDRARHYVQRWRERYPEIYMMEIAKRVNLRERGLLVQSMRDTGYPDFEIHTFGYETDRQVHLSPEKPVYYPIVFIEPELPAAVDVLGLDISDTSSVLKDALERSYAHQALVASKPFDLIENRRGYLLYRPVVAIEDRAVLERNWERELYTLIVVDTARLIPPWVDAQGRLDVMLSDVDTRIGDAAPLARAGPSMTQTSWLGSLLPLFEETQRLNSISQPFFVKVRYQVQWRDLNRQVFTVLLAVALITFLVADLLQNIIDTNWAAKEAERQRLNTLANYDSITGLPNRTLLLDRIEQAKRVARRRRTRFAVFFVDLDDFKTINDRLGHEAGNRALQSVGTRLVAAMRNADTVARIHGDEFVIVLNDPGSDADIEKITAKIRAAFDGPINVDGHSLIMSASVGYAVYPSDGETAEQLLDKGDKRMYLKKRASKISIADAPV